MCVLLSTDSLGTPVPQVALKHLAATAHEIWQSRMLAEGWTPGKRFDADARTHDAPVPCRELDYDHRWDAIEAAAGSAVRKNWPSSLTAPRGEGRPLNPARHEGRTPRDAGVVSGY